VFSSEGSGDEQIDINKNNGTTELCILFGNKINEQCVNLKWTIYIIYYTPYQIRAHWMGTWFCLMVIYGREKSAQIY